MAPKKKLTETQTETAAAPVASAPKARKSATPMQADLAVKVEELKKQISTVKALNKIIRVLENVDRNGLEQVQAWLTKKLGE